MTENSVKKHCNGILKVPGGPGGYLKTPGYPLYYIGEIPCGWKFVSSPGQRIILTFHDLSIRGIKLKSNCYIIMLYLTVLYDIEYCQLINKINYKNKYFFLIFIGKYIY